VKIAAAITIAAAGFGGGMAYKKFRAYLRDKDSRKQRQTRRKKPASMAEEQQAGSVAGKLSSQKEPRTRKRSATKSRRPATVK
jgi:hypothetical protein